MLFTVSASISGVMFHVVVELAVFAAVARVNQRGHSRFSKHCGTSPCKSARCQIRARKGAFVVLSLEFRGELPEVLVLFFARLAPRSAAALIRSTKLLMSMYTTALSVEALKICEATWTSARTRCSMTRWWLLWAPGTTRSTFPASANMPCFLRSSVTPATSARPSFATSKLPPSRPCLKV
jgi:hypothetical protein